MLSAGIVKGSCNPAFDEAALAGGSPFRSGSAAPPAVADEGLSFTLPVIFSGQGQGLMATRPGRPVSRP